MPMFYIPKPRRFRYEPRFYDPEKERWEALKAQHAAEEYLKQEAVSSRQPADSSVPTDDPDLQYFEWRVRSFDELSKGKPQKLTWRDMFRKREMPEFHYQPRFASDGAPAASTSNTSADDRREHLEEARQRKIRIKRRFDVSRDLQRKQQNVWIKVALALLVVYVVYRTYDPITRFLLNLFF